MKSYILKAKNILTILFLFLTFVALAQPKKVYASEGIVEMRSTTGEDTRCYVSSQLMQDKNYTLLVSCRDLIYPADVNIQKYYLWAVPVSGSKYVNFGSLEYGKKLFKTKTPFSSLLVTSEGKPGKVPGGDVIMRGTVEPITFLTRPTSPTPTPENQEESSAEEVQNPSTETQNLTTKEKLAQAFKKAGLAAGLALVALIGLIFVVTRSKG